jgi:subtilase family serine protease
MVTLVIARPRKVAETRQVDLFALLRAAQQPRRRMRRAGAGALVSAVVGAVAASAGPAAAVAAAAAGSSDTVAVAQPAVSGGARHPLQLKVLGRAGDATPLLTGSGTGGYTPAQIRALLGLAGTGAGQTIAVVTAYDAPNAAADLAVFNAAFGLPAPPSFRKVDQTGGTKFPRVDAGWALEAALDVQWAHAVAPSAAILLVEATTSGLSNLMAAVSWAAAQPGVSVVSGSFGLKEYSKQKDYDARCRLTTGVCVFASGDTGNPATYPATSPWALAVGGTTLTLDGAGSVLGETGWSGSGGGVSLYTPKPMWQSGVTAARRATPDVGYDADPTTGFAVYSSTPYDRQSGWFVLGGTSAGAPQWAGILASANQLRRAAGKPVLSAVTSSGATPLHTALYGAGLRGSGALADVTTGTNGTCGTLCTAGVGYDTVTGVGSPRRGLDLALRDAA